MNLPLPTLKHEGLANLFYKDFSGDMVQVSRTLTTVVLDLVDKRLKRLFGATEVLVGQHWTIEVCSKQKLKTLFAQYPNVSPYITFQIAPIGVTLF